jgi:dipeptidyl aminopeptidase/acylaminoacyl peptidase
MRIQDSATIASTPVNRRCFGYCVAAFLAVFLYILPSHTLGAEKKQRLTAEDILAITWAMQPELSPDGSQLLYKVLEKKVGQRHTTVWKSATKDNATPKQVLSELKGVNHLRWSPDAKRLAFLASGKTGRQLFVANADVTNAHPVTDMPNGVERFRWSADSTTIAFTADERPKKPSNIVVVGSVRHRAALWTVAVNRDEHDYIAPKRITFGDDHVIDFAWSPDGQEFAVAIAKSDSSEFTSPPAVLKILRRSDGKTVRIISENATGDCDITWSPDGKTIAAPVYAPRRISRRLAMFPAVGGKPTFPFANFHATPMSRIEWTADSKHMFVQFMENTRNQLVRLEVASGKLEHVSNELTNFWNYSISRDGSTIAFNAESQHDPPDIFVKKDNELHRLTDYNTDFEKFRLGNVKTVQWKSSIDDRTVYGVLITPPDFKAGQPVPTIVNLHSGPHWLWWEGWVGTYISWGQYLASNGYAVFLPNHRGSIGQGWEFAEAHYMEWGRGDYQDVMDGLDWLIKDGVADPERLGVGGSSFGGYLTAFTITQSNRFKAAVMDAGWSDLVSSNLTIDVRADWKWFVDKRV